MLPYQEDRSDTEKLFIQVAFSWFPASSTCSTQYPDKLVDIPYSNIPRYNRSYLSSICYIKTLTNAGTIHHQNITKVSHKKKVSHKDARSAALLQVSF
jgi:hypothetical protein